MIGDRLAGEIMVPAADIVSVTHDTPVDAALRIAIAADHRRIPVVRGEADGIIGFVRLRDLAAASDAEPPGSLAELAREALRVTPDVTVIELLRTMQSTGIHLAVVVGDGGEVLGLATIEDAAEELVGTIEDRRR